MCEVIIQLEKIIDYMTILDVLFKLATVFIAGFNAYFAVKIFRFKNEKDTKEKERDRKIQLLKTLVLDHNLKNYHSIFEDLENKLLRLKRPNLTTVDKQEIDSQIADSFIQLRSRFYDSLLAIDDSLYESIKIDADTLQTQITETIFDPGVNLTHIPKFDELISQNLTTVKTEIIRKLFNYRG